MRKNKRISVFLTGGLGNQFFQLAAVLARGSGAIQIDPKLGNPRVNGLGRPDLSDFNLPDHIEWDNRRNYNSFMSRIGGYVLRQGKAPKGIERLGIFRFCVLLCASIAISIQKRRVVRVIQATDNGFCDLPISSMSEYMIGYFQSYRWASTHSVVEQLHEIQLTNKSNSLQKFKLSLDSRNIGVVHIRLGDYKNLPSFGIPDKEYYKISLDILYRAIGFDCLLIFSNEPDEALSYIPTEYLDCSVIVPDFDGSAAETLEAMRLGNGYVIGNSTLSWWGAFLSYDRTAPVVAPDPWFRFNPDPTDIIPPHWIKVPAWSEDLDTGSSKVIK